jgi:general secretion pathway protein A
LEISVCPDVVALMYEVFFGLQERPFDLTPDPRFLFMTAGHREALTTIQYGISGRKGITLLVGPAGTGKTTLVQAALRTHDGVTVKALHLANPTLTRNEFFEFLALELNLTEAAAHSKTHFLRELDATLRQRHAAGIVTALIVDEAQALSDILLEEVRLLANSETSTDKLLPLVLIGQPELGTRLNERPLLQLKQRVALRASLAPLNLRETADYMAERIRVAGGDIRNVFAPEAVAAIYGCSGGIPRTISVICDNALVSGFALDQRPVGRSVIAEVCRDFDLPGPNGAPAGSVGPHAVPGAKLAAPAVAAPGSLILRPTATVPMMKTTLGLRAVENRGEAAPSQSEPKRGFRSLFARTASR